MDTEKDTFKKMAKGWILQGLTGKFVAISGQTILGFADNAESLPNNGIKFKIQLPSAGAWSDEPELLEYFYEAGLTQKP